MRFRWYSTRDPIRHAAYVWRPISPEANRIWAPPPVRKEAPPRLGERGPTIPGDKTLVMFVWGHTILGKNITGTGSLEQEWMAWENLVLETRGRRTEWLLPLHYLEEVRPPLIAASPPQSTD